MFSAKKLTGNSTTQNCCAVQSSDRNAVAESGILRQRRPLVCDSACICVCILSFSYSALSLVASEQHKKKSVFVYVVRVREKTQIPLDVVDVHQAAPTAQGVVALAGEPRLDIPEAFAAATGDS